MARRSRLAILFFLVPIALNACSTVSFFTPPYEHARRLAARAKFVPLLLKTNVFELRGFVTQGNAPNGQMSVYIEGDGKPWPSSTTPPRNPSPLDPVGLRLAIASSSTPVAYLARPCHFLEVKATEACGLKYWTHARFAPEVVESVSIAIDRIKARVAAKQIRLVGFSGGGVLAALVSARRSDVFSLVTVAAPLDLDAWTSHHNATPMHGSLRPTDNLQSLRQISQIHFSGSDDRIVPLSVLRSYLAKLGSSLDVRVVEIPNFNHQCCWADQWASILEEYVP